MKKSMTFFARPTLGLIIIIVLAASPKVFSQKQDDVEEFNQATIEEKVEYVIEESNNYQDYDVIKQSWMKNLQSQVSDTLKQFRRTLAQANRTIETANEQMDSLVSLLEATRSQLNTAVEEKNTLVFLGIPMNKTGYNAILWSIIGGLAVILVFFIFMFKRSNAITAESKANLAELKAEFEAFRKRALEREEKLARQYMDEILKYKQG